MEKQIKNLSFYPTSVFGGIYYDGTNLNLNTLIENGLLNMDYIKANSSKLEVFKGFFDYNNYSKLKSSSIQGDFWIWNSDVMTDIDTCWVAYPGDIIYRDGDYFKTIHVPQTNNVKPKEKYDVCIVGAGAGGIGAGYALKDAGYRVCIIERLDTLGGTHCNAGVGMLIASPTCNWYKTLVQEGYNQGKVSFYNNNSTDHVPVMVGTGSDFDKLYRATQFTDHGKKVLNSFCGNHIVINDAWYSKKYYDELSPNIDIFINCELQETISNSTDKTVDYIKVKNLITGKEFDICADYYIDCSGDGVLFTSDKKLTLDTDYYIGTDGKTRFNEACYDSDDTPNKYGINTVEPCYFQLGRRYNSGYSFPPLPTKYKTYSNITARNNFNYIAPGTNVKTVSNSYGTKMSLQKFIEYPNSWNIADGYDRALAVFMGGGYTTGNRFAGTRKMLAIREKYRVACEKTVDQNYLTKQITSSNYATEHIIGLSTWYVDIHNQSYSCVSNIANGVPYEALIPKCYTNVLCGSRCYGASHVGLSSVRLVKTMLDLGHSAGVAIKQLLDSNTRGDVRTVDVAQVQTEIGIADVITELETYFYGDTVESTTATS